MNFSKHQFKIVSLLFLTVVINYIDRTNVSIAASGLQKDLNISPTQMGLVFSAFFWTYALCQIPGGYVADKFLPRILYPFLLIAWSIATILQGFVNSMALLLVGRSVVAAFEAPTYPINNKVVTSWFPENKRASAIAIYTSGQYVGMAALAPVLFLIQKHYGWQGLFIITGLAGVIWAFIWYGLYRDPTQQQLREIHKEEENSAVEVDEEAKPQSQNIGLAFTHPKLWGLYLGQFCLGTTTIFFLTWFPSYLMDERGIEISKSGLLASLPFAAAFCGILLSGFLSDFLDRKGYSKTISRKLPVLVGMLISTCTFGVIFTENNALIIALLSLAFFGNGVASIAWVFVSIMAPKDRIGLVGGVFNFAGAASAFVTPLVIGFLIERSSFSAALIYIASVALLGVFIYLFLVGKVERVKIISSDKTDEFTGEIS
ncbi:MFS transporter [Hirschia maritima]|uniref:MFS transporter n=1 Tax=Hirschia maritima TaxID=1121961 RepID=UPI0003816FC6|nr:MFS transporter [Hirschia maritima]